jgi:hypothetical protein
MLLESDYIQPPKPLPPLAVRVFCRSQLTAALSQHARPIVIEGPGACVSVCQTATGAGTTMVGGW